MSRREWSCEHCGRPTTDAPHKCQIFGCSMCERCTDYEDIGGPCPYSIRGTLSEPSDEDTQALRHGSMIATDYEAREMKRAWENDEI